MRLVGSRTSSVKRKLSGLRPRLRRCPELLQGFARSQSGQYSSLGMAKIDESIAMLLKVYTYII